MLFEHYDVIFEPIELKDKARPLEGKRNGFIFNLSVTLSNSKDYQYNAVRVFIQ